MNPDVGIDRGTLSKDTYGGGSSAENAGTSEQIVQALSGVGSCCVVRLSYAYANSKVNNVRYKFRCRNIAHILCAVNEASSYSRSR